jgi:hypothetical protein
MWLSSIEGAALARLARKDPFHKNSSGCRHLANSARCAAPTLCLLPSFLEVELPPKLYGARIVGGGDLSEVLIARVLIDVIKLRVIENIEELEA